MAIIFKKKPKTTEDKPAAPAPVKVDKPIYKGPDAWKNLPIAPTMAEYLAAPVNTMRPPDPVACRMCGNHYPYPCHGAKDNCMNKRFAEERNAAAGNS